MELPQQAFKSVLSCVISLLRCLTSEDTEWRWLNRLKNFEYYTFYLSERFFIAFSSNRFIIFPSEQSNNSLYFFLIDSTVVGSERVK